MLDFVLGLGLVFSLVRGYSRGFLRGAVGLVVTLAAIWFGYRAGPSGVAVVESWSGADPVVARIVGSVLVFGVVAVVGMVVVYRSVAIRGPLQVFDRLAGSVLSGVWYLVVCLLMILVVSAAPNLSPIAERVFADSRAVGLVTAEESPIVPSVSRLLGDRVLESVVNLNRLVGHSRMIIQNDDRLDLPQVEPSAIHESPESSEELFEKLNMARFEEGIQVLSWSSVLAGVASGHGKEMYEEGYFSHTSPTTGSVASRLDALGIPYLLVGENLALTPTVESAHEGLLESPSHRATMLDPRFRRVGVAAWEGPLGLMVVQVFSG